MGDSLSEWKWQSSTVDFTRGSVQVKKKKKSTCFIIFNQQIYRKKRCIGFLADNQLVTFLIWIWNTKLWRVQWGNYFSFPKVFKYEIKLWEKVDSKLSLWCHLLSYLVKNGPNSRILNNWKSKGCNGVQVGIHHSFCNTILKFSFKIKINTCWVGWNKHASNITNIKQERKTLKYFQWKSSDREWATFSFFFYSTLKFFMK